MLYLLVALGFMFFAGVAMTINEGLWSNTILLISVIISGLAGMIGGVPLGVVGMEQTGKAGEFAWFFVFAGIWAVFTLCMLLMRIVVDKISRVRVRFLPIVDKIGGILIGLFAALMLTSFAANTLKDAPIRAGAWNINDASEGQKSLFRQVTTPFFSVSNKFVQAESIKVLGK